MPDRRDARAQHLDPRVDGPAVRERRRASRAARAGAARAPGPGGRGTRRSAAPRSARARPTRRRATRTPWSPRIGRSTLARLRSSTMRDCRSRSSTGSRTQSHNGSRRRGGGSASASTSSKRGARSAREVVGARLFVRPPHDGHAVDLGGRFERALQRSVEKFHENTSTSAGAAAAPASSNSVSDEETRGSAEPVSRSGGGRCGEPVAAIGTEQRSRRAPATRTRRAEQRREPRVAARAAGGSAATRLALRRRGRR